MCWSRWVRGGEDETNKRELIVLIANSARPIPQYSYLWYYFHKNWTTWWECLASIASTSCGGTQQAFGDALQRTTWWSAVRAVDIDCWRRCGDRRIAMNNKNGYAKSYPMAGKTESKFFQGDAFTVSADHLAGMVGYYSWVGWWFGCSAVRNVASF
jgi:hypothetical protein